MEHFRNEIEMFYNHRFVTVMMLGNLSATELQDYFLFLAVDDESVLATLSSARTVVSG